MPRPSRRPLTLRRSHEPVEADVVTTCIPGGRGSPNLDRPRPHQSGPLMVCPGHDSRRFQCLLVKERAYYLYVHVIIYNNRDDDGTMGNRYETTGTSENQGDLEWFGYVKRRDGTENIRAIVEMKTEGKRPRGRPTFLLGFCCVLMGIGD